jgi:hypothetical protein
VVQFPLVIIGGFDKHHHFLPYAWFILGGRRSHALLSDCAEPLTAIKTAAREVDDTWEPACFIQDGCGPSRAAIGEWQLFLAEQCISLEPSTIAASSILDLGLPRACVRLQGGVRLGQARSALPLACPPELADSQLAKTTAQAARESNLADLLGIMYTSLGPAVPRPEVDGHVQQLLMEFYDKHACRKTLRLSHWGGLTFFRV